MPAFDRSDPRRWALWLWHTGGSKLLWALAIIANLGFLVWFVKITFFPSFSAFMLWRWVIGAAVGFPLLAALKAYQERRTREGSQPREG